MARYYFDIENGALRTVDHQGRELDSYADARRAALMTLPEVVKDSLPDGGREIVTVHVRNSDGRSVCVAVVSLITVDLERPEPTATGNSNRPLRPLT